MQVEEGKQYKTRSGKRVIGIHIVPKNSAGHEVTFPVKGSIVVREKPYRLRYQIWTMEGKAGINQDARVGHQDDLAEEWAKMEKKSKYEELEGTEVHYFIPENKEYVEVDCIGVIVGCEPGVGITIVRKDNKKSKLYCLNRKTHNYDSFDAEFEAVVKIIQSGEVNGIELVACGPPSSNSPFGFMTECAFVE